MNEESTSAQKNLPFVQTKRGQQQTDEVLDKAHQIKKERETEMEVLAAKRKAAEAVIESTLNYSDDPKQKLNIKMGKA